MEKRVILAIVLMIAVIFLTNILFPPAPPPPDGEPARDTAARVEEPAPAPEEAEEGAAEGEESEEAIAERMTRAAGDTTEREPVLDAPVEGEDGDTVRVRTPLYTLDFTTRGASAVRAALSRYSSYTPNGAGEDPAQLIREGDRMFGYRVAVPPDTLDLRGRIFEASARELRLEPGSGPDSLVFRYEIPTRNPEAELAFRVTYTFDPDEYAIGITGALEGLGGRGYTVLSLLGRGLRTNEQDPEEDYGQLAYVVNGEDSGIESREFGELETGQTRTVEGGPFRWVAVKNKYFLAALSAPEERPGFGGMVVTGDSEDHSALMEASLPVPAGEDAFSMLGYLGPQEFDRLARIGQDLQNVNPMGWDWLGFIIRPLAGLIITLLTWIHGAFDLAYGWVLILFGVMMRVVLFPLYQKSMRAQMAQMQVQPLMKEIQAKYEDEPEKLQKEMVRLYKEHNINPVAGCLPMLLPFPILITLFFVFQSTIEFRGVPFLWLPDLSLKDPLYAIPLVMGLSMFLLQMIGQRGMERNLQMKLMGYGMPVIFTIVFLNFPSGLNLYYATSNLASLPQQLYLSKERRKARENVPSPSSS